MTRGQSRWAALLAALALTLPAVRALAEDHAAGEMYVEPRGGVYGSTSETVTVMATYGGAAGVYVLDGVAVEAEGLGYYIDQNKKVATPGGPGTKDYSTDAAGAGINARWHFARTSQGSVFVGAGGGALFSGRAVPATGTTQSGTGQADLGVSYSVTKNVSLKAAGRYQHIGAFSDTGASALGGNVGVKITF